VFDLYLARHGDYGTNAFRSPDPSLSTRGERQAELLGQRLSEVGVTAIVSSPLVRARQTAEHVARALTFDHAIDVWAELREGNQSDERASFIHRATRVLTRIEENFGDGDAVLVVSHGGITNFLLQAAVGTADPARVFFVLGFCSVSHLRLTGNGAPLREDWPLYPAPEVEVVTIDDTSHLRDAGLEQWGG
jgi:broad specificity phosphatase PhoE